MLLVVHELAFVHVAVGVDEANHADDAAADLEVGAVAAGAVRPLDAARTALLVVGEVAGQHGAVETVQSAGAVRLEVSVVFAVINTARWIEQRRTGSWTQQTNGEENG